MSKPPALPGPGLPEHYRVELTPASIPFLDALAALLAEQVVAMCADADDVSTDGAATPAHTGSMADSTPSPDPARFTPAD